MAPQGLFRSLSLAVTILAATAWGQQLDGYFFSFDTMGLSDPCFAAVNTTVSSCPAWLARYSGISDASFDILNSSQLETLCGGSCRRDLVSLRNSIQAACTASTDVVVPGGTIAYPATFLTDRFIYATDLSCLTDPSTGEYCDVVVAGWMNETEYTTAQNCSMCELGIQQIQLASPFGYSDDGAADFSSLTASCSASGYTYATPTAYALNATTVSTSTPTCTGSSYVIQGNDTCVSISGANSVSTYGLITKNALDISGDSLPVVGQSLCLPRTCTTYQLDMQDTCDSLVSGLNITMAQLLAWNPNINSGCSNLASWRGWYLCASSPSGSVTVPEGNGVTTAAPVPTNAQGQSNTDCGEWYLVQSGDYCASISLKFGISLNDFYFLNPQVNSNCTNLWLNTSYCVEAVGNIATYSGYPVSTASFSFTKPPPSPSFTASPVSTPTLNPTAPGTIDNCYVYENAFSANVTNVDGANSCQNWAWNAEVTVNDLISWNPSLSADSCVLQSGYSYCIRLWDTAPTETFPYDYCMTPNTTLIPPSSVQPSDCDCYIQLRAADKGAFNCSMFPTLFNITVTDVTTLNPWIGSDCDTGVWSALSSDGYEQLCVGQGQSNSSTSSSSSIPASTSTPTTTTSASASATTTSTGTAPPAPTQPGAASNCTKWHTVVSGDGCQAIADEYGISLSDFYSWNPGVGSDCSSLWLNYAVCVEV